MTTTSYLKLCVLSLMLLVSSLVYAGGTITERTKIAEDVTTNTTTAAFKIPSGVKSIFGQVTGSGAVTQTQALYGDKDADAANGVLLCTITLSGTNVAVDACPPFQGNFYWFYLVTTNTTGTGATGVVYAMY